MVSIFHGREIAQRVVGALLVVFNHPPVDRLADIVEACKQRLIQQFLADGSNTVVFRDLQTGRWFGQVG